MKKTKQQLAYWTTYRNYLKYRNRKLAGLQSYKERKGAKIGRVEYHELVYLREIKRLTLEEVGKRFGITRERVRQLTQKEPPLES